jgi:hypothetical protein
MLRSGPLNADAQQVPGDWVHSGRQRQRMHCRPDAPRGPRPCTPDSYHSCTLRLQRCRHDYPTLNSALVYHPGVLCRPPSDRGILHRRHVPTSPPKASCSRHPRACRASCDPGSSTSDGPPSPPAAAMALLHAVHAAAGPVPVGGDTPGAATWITPVLRSGPLNYVTEQVWLQSVYSVYSVFSILYIQYSVYSVFNAYSLHSCVPA